ncbi:MAG: AraD1 family protein [Bryobacteraceae bacterium]
MRLIQLAHPNEGRRIAAVEGAHLRLLASFHSIYALAETAIATAARLAAVAERSLSTQTLDYEEIYHCQSEWRVLPAFDHPEEPARCLVSGTGLTHKASADNRNAMHGDADKLTDSMRMYFWGVEGGRPGAGEIGKEPEWFYKGSGTILRAHGEPLFVPAYSNDGGEEPEIACAYLIDPAGTPRRVGMMAGNEFSDHRLEKLNYLYLASSKLRTCAVGPELVVDAAFGFVPGSVSIRRAGQRIWTKEISSGEIRMSHTLENLEHHHFKHAAHRRPGDAHVHFLGADAFSFGDGIQLASGDVMSIEFSGFGRALRNPIEIDDAQPELVRVEAL